MYSFVSSFSVGFNFPGWCPGPLVTSGDATLSWSHEESSSRNRLFTGLISAPWIWRCGRLTLCPCDDQRDNEVRKMHSFQKIVRSTLRIQDGDLLPHWVFLIASLPTMFTKGCISQKEVRLLGIFSGSTALITKPDRWFSSCSSSMSKDEIVRSSTTTTGGEILTNFDG